MKKSVEIQSFRAEEGKSRTRKEDTVATLQKFARVAKFSQPSATFDFFFVFFSISPHVIVFILYTLVICIDLVVYITPKEHFVKMFLIIEVLGEACYRSSRFLSFLSFLSFSFSLSHWPNTLCG